MQEIIDRMFEVDSLNELSQEEMKALSDLYYDQKMTQTQATRFTTMFWNSGKTSMT